MCLIHSIANDFSEQHCVPRVPYLSQALSSPTYTHTPPTFLISFTLCEHCLFNFLQTVLISFIRQIKLFINLQFAPLYFPASFEVKCRPSNNLQQVTHVWKWHVLLMGQRSGELVSLFYSYLFQLQKPGNSHIEMMASSDIRNVCP